MNRRTMLKRLGVAGFVIPAAGTASATDPMADVPFEGHLVREDGRIFVYRSGVDPDDVSTSDCCTCDEWGYTECTSTCDCCEPCRRK